MRKSPEGKWQKASVPLDGATLAVMQEHVRMRWASLSTDMRLSCFPCFDWMIGPAVHSCLISRNPPFDRPMKQKWGGCLKKKKKSKSTPLLLSSSWTYELIYHRGLGRENTAGSGSGACVTWPLRHGFYRADRSHPTSQTKWRKLSRDIRFVRAD